MDSANGRDHKRMIMRNRLLYGFVAVLLGTTSLAACGSDSGSSDGLQEVSVAFPEAISDAGVLIADSQGYFEEEGIKVDIQRQSINDATLRLASGDLDVAGGSLSVSFLKAVARGSDMRIIGDKGTLTPDTKSYGALLVPTNSSLEDVGDLAGKSVALYSTAGFPSYILSIMLQDAGLTLDDVNLKVMDPTTMLQALGNSSIDAGVVFEPGLVQAEQRDIGRILAEPSGETVGAGFLFGSQGFMSDKELATGFMRAYLKGVRDYDAAFFPEKSDSKSEATREEIVQILTETTTAEDPELYDNMRFVFIDTDGDVNLKGIEQQIQFYAESGQIEAPIPAKDVVDMSFAMKAVKSLE